MASSEKAEELENELNWLRSENIIYTKIATKTKLDVDRAPGIITILQGDELANRGVQKVWEALQLVPGYAASIETTGVRLTPVRGVGGTFASGNIKILLNNISMNTTITAQSNAVLNMPVEQVERIEIIRGPGSAVHGEYAYSGVVNVITRKDGQRIYGSFGNYRTFEGGGAFSWVLPENDLKLTLNIAGLESNGADPQAGKDWTYAVGYGSLSYAPGRTNENKSYRSALFTLEYKNFSLTADYLQDGHGDTFGIYPVLSPNENRIKMQDTQWDIEAKQTFYLSNSLQADIKLTLQDYVFKSFDLFYYPALPFPPYNYANTSREYHYYHERRFKSGFDLTYDGLDKHKIFFECSISDINIVDAWISLNKDLDAAAAIKPMISYQKQYRGANNWINEHQNRTISSVMIQDEFNVTDSLTLTGALRYDHYNDVGGNPMPRISAVYRWSPHHILKAQYSKAFRPPTFYEMFGSKSIKPETIDSYELGYIYKDDFTTGRVTVFYSNLKNVIALSGVSASGKYINSLGSHLSGAELEIEQQLTSKVNLDANLSFLHTKNKETEREIEDSAKWLANIGLQYTPLEDLLLTTQYRYVGEKNRHPTDSRKTMKKYHTVDLTGSLFNFGMKGLTLGAGVKNMFNEDVRYPSSLITVSGTPYPIYPSDLPRGKREGWMRISFEF